MQRSTLKLSPQDDGIATLAAGVSLHSSKEKSRVRPSGCAWRSGSTRVFLQPSPP